MILDELRLACGGEVNGVMGKEDSNKVEEIFSEYPFSWNEKLDEDGVTALIIASMRNAISVVDFLLSSAEWEDIDVNKQDKVLITLSYAVCLILNTYLFPPMLAWNDRFTVCIREGSC
jgi:hypothetical protein